MTPLLPAPSDTLESDTRPEPTKPATRQPSSMQPASAPFVESRLSTKRKVLLGTGAAVALTAIFVFAIAAPHLDEGIGDRTYNPTTFEAVEPHYEFGIGSLTVDLRDVDFPAGTHHITVDHGIGSARVYLPADVNYDVTGDLSAGEIDVVGETEDGFDNVVSARIDGSSAATVIVDLEVNVGHGRVRQG